jgi:phosphoglycolate phosphatase
MVLPFDLIVFDLDGTLVDSLPDLAAAANFALRRLGLPEHPPAVMQQMIGGGEKKFVRRFLGPDHQNLFDDALALYLEHYSRHCGDHTSLYPGVRETLARLPHLKLAVLSNKREDLSRKVVQVMGLGNFFAAVRGGDSYGALKPSPEGLRALINELGGNPARTLMVGDKPEDVLAARGAGTRVVALTYGYGDPEALTALSPDSLLDRFPPLLDFVAF